MGLRVRGQDSGWVEGFGFRIKDQRVHGLVEIRGKNLGFGVSSFRVREFKGVDIQR